MLSLSLILLFFLNLNCGCYSTFDVVLEFMISWYVHCFAIVYEYGNPNKPLYMKDNLRGLLLSCNGERDLSFLLSNIQYWAMLNKKGMYCCL